ncbi:MAG: hypothetical protein ACYC6B_07215 [Thermoleophilia bacterium]
MKLFGRQPGDLVRSTAAPALKYAGLVIELTSLTAWMTENTRFSLIHAG